MRWGDWRTKSSESPWVWIFESSVEFCEGVRKLEEVVWRNPSIRDVTSLNNTENKTWCHLLSKSWTSLVGSLKITSERECAICLGDASRWRYARESHSPAMWPLLPLHLCVPWLFLSCACLGFLILSFDPSKNASKIRIAGIMFIRNFVKYESLESPKCG